MILRPRNPEAVRLSGPGIASQGVHPLVEHEMRELVSQCSEIRTDDDGVPFSAVGPVRQGALSVNADLERSRADEHPRKISRAVADAFFRIHQSVINRLMGHRVSMVNHDDPARGVGLGAELARGAGGQGKQDGKGNVAHGGFSSISKTLSGYTLALLFATTLAWDANTEPELAGYRIYYGTAPRTYGAPIDVGNVTTYKVQGLTRGQRYYFAATAYDAVGNESGFSNEVSAVELGLGTTRRLVRFAPRVTGR